MLKNKVIQSIQEKVLDSNIRILLPEQNDFRVKKAIEFMRKSGYNLIDINEFNENQLYKDHIRKKKFTNNWTEKMLDSFILCPVNKALINLDLNQVDCVVAGATLPTSDIIKSSIRIVGIKKSSKWISSSFFLINSNDNKMYTFADCGVIPEPNEDQLVSIAFESSTMHQLLSNEEPKIAFLSFSTKGSAEHYTVTKIQKTVEKFSKKYPHIIHDGELQFDAAINQQASKNKVKNSILNGEANVFIFPDLNSGNIAYKIAQYLAKYDAWGPLLQGLNKPVHDLSRGCNTDDIISIASIAAFQSI